MGTTVEILLHVGDPGDDGAALLDWAAGEVERLEQAWSRFRPDSELCRLNDSPEPVVEVSDTMLEVMARARIGWELTGGRFDPTIIDSLESLGYVRSFQTFEGPTGGGPVGPSSTMADVSVDTVDRTVSRPTGVRFDLGGIGKGLMADLVAVGLVERGARSACVGAGGDVRVAGEVPDGGWNIPVAHPVNGGEWFTASLTEGAIVTSTTVFRRWITEAGTPAHHIIDPVTGSPSGSGLDTVVVAAADAWWAEVLAKAALIAGHDDGVALLGSHGVTGWMVSSVEVAA